MQLTSKQSGITLIEMMIAMILGLLVVGAIITIFISNVKSSSENIRMIHLNQELRSVMGFMSDELKRAGYSADPDSSEFIDEIYTATPNCILYAYDVDGDGVRDNNERFGFKLDGSAIEWGQNRTAKTCTSGVWTALTETTIANITALTIVPTAISTANSTIQVQHIDVTIIGQISLNPGIASRQVTDTIRVRNEDAD